MPVFPEVGSTMVPPGFRRPSRSAASMIRVAVRSFDEPPGLRYSTFTRMVAATPSVTLLSFTSGVLPTISITLLAYFIVIEPTGGGCAVTVRGAAESVLGDLLGVEARVDTLLLDELVVGAAFDDAA